jgi:hypothetical protein
MNYVNTENTGENINTTNNINNNNTDNNSTTLEKLLETLSRHTIFLNKYFRININDNMELTTLPDILYGYTPSKEYLPIFLYRLTIKLSELDSKIDGHISWEDIYYQNIFLTMNTEQNIFKDLTSDMLYLIIRIKLVCQELSYYYAHLSTESVINNTDDVNITSASISNKSSKNSIFTSPTSDYNNSNSNSNKKTNSIKSTNKNISTIQLTEKSKNIFEHTVYPAIRHHLLSSKMMIEQDVFLPITTLEKLYRVFERC